MTEHVTNVWSDVSIGGLLHLPSSLKQTTPSDSTQPDYSAVSAWTRVEVLPKVVFVVAATIMIMFAKSSVLEQPVSIAPQANVPWNQLDPHVCKNVLTYLHDPTTAAYPVLSGAVCPLYVLLQKRGEASD